MRKGRGWGSHAVWALSSLSTASVFKSQTRIVQSPAPVTSFVPSGENATTCAVPVPSLQWKSGTVRTPFRVTGEAGVHYL